MIMSKNIAIVGLGYVGLPLSLQFARSGVTVQGLDVDLAKVEALTRGISYIKHIESAEIAAMVQSGRFSASTDFRRIAQVEAIIICVPTPLNKNREPDISFIIQTGQAIDLPVGKTERLGFGQLFRCQAHGRNHVCKPGRVSRKAGPKSSLEIPRGNPARVQLVVSAGEVSVARVAPAGAVVGAGAGPGRPGGVNSRFTRAWLTRVTISRQS